MVKLTLVAAFAAIVTAVPASASTIVINGGFEQPGGTVRDQLTTNYLHGWTYNSNGTGYDIYEDDTQDGLLAADGHHYVSFGHNGTYGGSLTQTFATTAGLAYHLSLSAAEQQGDDPTQRFLIELTTSLGGYYSFYVGNLTSSFVTSGVTFHPDGVSTTLKITDATPPGGGGGSNLALDAISVTQLGAGAVPEPAIWAMMIGGFGGVGYGMRKHKKTARRVAFA